MKCRKNPFLYPVLLYHFHNISERFTSSSYDSYVPKLFQSISLLSAAGGIFRDNKNTAVISRYGVARTPTKWGFDSRRRKNRGVIGSADLSRSTARNEENGGSVLVELCRRVSLPFLENIVKGFAHCLFQLLLDLGLYHSLCGGLLLSALVLFSHAPVLCFHDLFRGVSIQVHCIVVVWQVLKYSSISIFDSLLLLDLCGLCPLRDYFK